MLMSSIEGSSKKVPKSGIGCNSVEVMDSGGYSQCSKHLKAIQNKFIKPWTGGPLIKIHLTTLTQPEP